MMRASAATRLVALALAGAALFPTTLFPNTALAADRTTPALRQPVLSARVTKPFGAAIRTAPDSDAPVVYSSDCGDLWPVLEVRDGWVRVSNGLGDGWIGGGRVAVGSPPAQASCGGAVSLHVGEYVETFVPTGCLSLRATPSRSAAILTCVSNGHAYAIVNGPFDPGTGEDWFEVYSRSTGGGWVLAEHLYAS